MTSIQHSQINAYLSGSKLYGDDFRQSQIDAWFDDEARGYSDLVNSGATEYVYGYAALNQWHGFSKLSKRRFSNVLALGAAYGAELQPILHQSDRITIIEPAGGFQSTEIQGVPVNYIKPNATGAIAFPDSSVDLITCFGVLHHIPNVSFVIGEFGRVLAPGGIALVREPIISMGDWREPRRGLTRHERGIPLSVLREAITRAELDVIAESKCMFSLTSRLHYLIKKPVFNSTIAVGLDAIVSAFPLWSSVYHAKNAVQKLRPTSVFCVLRK